MSWLPYKFCNPFLYGVLVWIAAESEVGNIKAEASTENRVFPVLPFPALMAGAFLLHALSPEDGIPVVPARSCSAALHCDEFSTDVFLLSLFSTLPVYFSLPPVHNHGVVAFSKCVVLLFSIFLLNVSVSCGFSSCCVCVCTCMMHTLNPCLLYEQTTTVDLHVTAKE